MSIELYDYGYVINIINFIELVKLLININKQLV